MNALDDTSRHELLKRGLRLEIFTLAWNVIEGLVAIGAGLASGSVALIGFGIDSWIEIVSGAALYWRLRKETNGDKSDLAEEKARRVVGVTFFLLTAYVAYEAATTLLEGKQPRESLVGIILAILSLAIMPFLGLAKYRLGVKLGSRALVADSKETLACSYLSATLLVGLGLHSWLGWWWGDSVAALMMVPWLWKEGMEAVRGKENEEDD